MSTELYKLKPIFIEATDLSDSWFQTIYKIIEHGKKFVIDKGSFEGQKRLEFDYITIHIKYPGNIPLLPKINPYLGIPDPVADGYLDDYIPYLMTGEEKEGESYTYGQRICGSDLNQMEMMIETYKKFGHRNNQMILTVGKPSDMSLTDPPCLRHIDTRIMNGKLHFFPYFRSWDLWGGFPANLAAIEIMKQYCSSEIGVDNGEIIASSKGLHLYKYVFELAEAIRGKGIDDFRE